MNGTGDSVETGKAKKERRRPDWLGGFIRETKSGRPIYVIEKRIGGRLFKASTRCHTEDAAIKELRRFEANPRAYHPGEAGLALTKELILEHVDWHLAPAPLGAGNSREWALDLGNMLGDWLEALDGRDLRNLAATEVKATLKTWGTSLPNRVVALKGLYTWLRKEKGLLKHFEDPMPDVVIPERKAAKNTSTGFRDHDFKKVRRVWKHLRADVRDVYEFLAATGWHLADARRFVTGGEIRKDPTGKHLATLVTWHKAKEDAVIGITNRRHLALAKKLRAKGEMLSNSTLAAQVRRANRKAGVKGVRFAYLGDMRHSFSTWAIEDGHEMSAVARHNNHTSEKMLRQHYVRHAVPRATIKARVLK
jgi:integrase